MSYKCPVIIRGVQYKSIVSAARDLGINESTVRKALDAGRLDFCGLGTNATNKRSVFVDGVKCESQWAAARRINANCNGFSSYLIDKRNHGIRKFLYNGHIIEQMEDK